MVYDGSKNVTTAGTRETLTSSTAMAFTVTVQAKKTNTKSIWVGGKTVAAGRGFELPGPGDSYTFPPQSMNTYDLTVIYIDSEADGEGVTFVYSRR